MQVAQSPLPPSFMKLGAAVVNHISQLYMQKAPACALKKNQKAFFDFISAYRFESEANAGNPFMRTTFNFDGVELLDEQKYIIELGGAESESWMPMRVLFSFMFSLGGVSKYANLNRRLAAGVSSHLFLVNKALLGLMKGLQVQMLQRGRRAGRAIGMSTLNSDGDHGETKQSFSAESFLDTYNRYLTMVSAKVHLFSQEEIDLHEVAALNELLGMNEPMGMEEEGFQPEDQAEGVKGDLMDIVFQMQVLLKLNEHVVTVRGGDGTSHDLHGLTLEILRGAIEESFQENADEHYYKESIMRSMINKDLFKFYGIFWRNYLGNILPILLMSFLNFTHATSIFDELMDQPFLNALLNVGAEEGLGLDSDEVGFYLGWFTQEAAAQEQGLQADMERAVDQPSRRADLKDVFSTYSGEFNEEMRIGVNLAERVLGEYSGDLDNRKTVLFASFTKHMKAELALQERIVSGGSDPAQWTLNIMEILSTELSQTYGIHPVHLETYLMQGMELTELYVREETGVDIHGAPFAFHALLHLIVKWVTYNGLPSTRWFLFNTWLKPFRPLSEGLGQLEGTSDGGMEGVEGDGQMEQEEDFPPEVGDEEEYEVEMEEEEGYEGDDELEEDEFVPDVRKMAAMTQGKVGIPSFLVGAQLQPPGQSAMK